MSSEIPVSETPTIELVLPREASARLERARADAEKHFTEGVRVLFPSGRFDLEKKRPDVDVLLFEYIHALWVTFAEEALNSPSATWIVRRHIEEYLRVLISKAFREKHPSARNENWKEQLQSFGSMTLTFLKLKMNIWNEVQEALVERSDRELAALAAASTPSPSAHPGVHESAAHGRRERAADLSVSSERVRLEDELRSELAAIKLEVGESPRVKVADLKKKFADYELWSTLSPQEQDTLLTEEFKPRAYAGTLVMRRYGLTNSETIKKDRQKVRRASQK